MLQRKFTHKFESSSWHRTKMLPPGNETFQSTVVSTAFRFVTEFVNNVKKKKKKRPNTWNFTYRF